MNLNTTIDIDLKGFFRWWGGELAFLVPKALRRRLRDRQGCVIFMPKASGFDVEFWDDDGNIIVKRNVGIADSGAFQQLKNQYPGIEKAEFVLRLPGEQALQKMVYLPVAVQENLQQVVSFELDRYTPFKAEQVYFNVVLLGQTGHGQIRVLLIVVPKARLDEQLTLLEAWEVRPHRVDYQQALVDFPQAQSAYNLLPDQYLQRSGKLNQSAQWLTGASLLSLLLAVLILPVWMEGQAVESLKAHIRQLENQNRIVDAQQQEIDALHAETQKLIDIKHQSPILLPVLHELSNLLNDETWLTHLQFSGRQMQIQGQSPAASALIGLLEGSEFFSNVSFVSPLTQDKTTGRERFQISMDVSMPASMAIEDSAETEQENGEAADADEAVPSAEELDAQATEQEVSDE